ncbi:MAG: rRNA pseudouridine synthase, partial [Flavobacteriaceae bacterium]|nr:rRNA pseudouridine synthase [Flavobacteriaceae bacterium]
VVRLFHIELDKNLKAEDLHQIAKGITVDKKEIRVEEISYVEGAPKKQIGLKIKHVGNRVIRTIFDHLNYQVVKVDCVIIGTLTKKDLPRGTWKHLNQQEVNNLKML